MKRLLDVLCVHPYSSGFLVSPLSLNPPGSWQTTTVSMRQS
jgi:hypothetical protein